MDKGKDILALCDQIRQVAFDLHVYLRHGHLEKVYEIGLVSRHVKNETNISGSARLGNTPYDSNNKS